MVKTAKRGTIAHEAASTGPGESKPFDVRSKRVQGLLLRVQPSGLRTFYVAIGRGKRLKLGPAGLMTLRQAEERAKALLLDPGSATAPRKGASLLEYIDEHYADHALAKLKNGAQSLGRVKATWEPLLQKRIDSITATDIDRLRNKRLLAGKAPGTVNRDVAALSSVFAHWVARTPGAVHPLADLDALKVADDERVRYLTTAESKRLRAALAARDANGHKRRASANEWRTERGYQPMPERSGYFDHMTPMTLLSLNVGVRQGELFSLEWESVDLARRTLTVLASHSKGNATRHIPLNDEAMAVLQAIKPKVAAGLVFPSPITGKRFNNVKKAWAEITAAAKLPDLRWHDLRHTFASQLVMSGASLFVVQKLLGHSTPKMTMRYAKLAPDQLADAVALLSPRRAA
ncbi:MAG: site-specific integrase [bacterium]